MNVLQSFFNDMSVFQAFILGFFMLSMADEYLK